MNFDEVAKGLDEIKEGNREKPRLTESQIAYILQKEFFTSLGYLKTHIKEQEKILETIPDIVLQIQKNSLPIDIKKSGELSSAKSRLKHIEEKAIYAIRCLPASENRWFCILTDGETWLIFGVEKGAKFHRVRLLLQFEAVTPQSRKNFTQNLSKSKHKHKEKFAANLGELDWQLAVTKCTFSRFTPDKIQNFLKFLWAVHSELTWKEFNEVMNADLRIRAAKYQERAGKFWHSDDKKFVETLYRNPRLAVGGIEHIIEFETMQIPVEAPKPMKSKKQVTSKTKKAVGQ